VGDMTLNKPLVPTRTGSACARGTAAALGGTHGDHFEFAERI
jgi:hypothetical protein